MAFEAKSWSVTRTLSIGTVLLLAVSIGGCAATREKDAEDAEAAAARSQAAAERAEAAAQKALEASDAAMKEADKAAAAVRDATREMDRVSAHLEQLQKEREEEEAGETKRHHPKKPASAGARNAGAAVAKASDGKSISDKAANVTTAADAAPAAQPSPAK